MKNPSDKEELLDMDVQLAVMESRMNTWIEDIRLVQSKLSFLRHKIHGIVKEKFEQD